MPNVFIGGVHLGGNDDTQSAAASGKLQEMLGLKLSSPGGVMFARASAAHRVCRVLSCRLSFANPGEPYMFSSRTPPGSTRGKSHLPHPPASCSYTST